MPGSSLLPFFSRWMERKSDMDGTESTMKLWTTWSCMVASWSGGCCNISEPFSQLCWASHALLTDSDALNLYNPLNTNQNTTTGRWCERMCRGKLLSVSQEIPDRLGGTSDRETQRRVRREDGIEAET